MRHHPHILIAFGTRPEAIKLAPLVLELQAADLRVTTCAIAQHRDLLDAALGAFGIVPDLDLDLMVPDQDLGALTARILGRMCEVFAATQPDVLVVQGDTTSAMAAAIAATQARIPVAHVEAGLRTSTIADPWPEEANRRVITRLAAVHFAPTEHARTNLLAEGVHPGSIAVTGNTGTDAARLTTPVDAGIGADDVVVTCHRRENQRDDFQGAARFFREVAQARPDLRFVLPIHPSPRVMVLADRLGAVANFSIVDPLPYPAMLGAIRAARAVITDSGGVQEESAWFGTPCLVTRAETDRPESVAGGGAAVVGLESRVALEALQALGRPSPSTVFGDGHASVRIARQLAGYGS